MTVTLIRGDCREVLRELPAASVHCVVTSPPYFGLRDYGVAGQIGLEPTPAAYVAELVGVLGEAKRVLRDDGTLWLNLGDSYCAPGGGFSPDAPSNIAGSKQAKTHPHATKEIRKDIVYELRPKNLLGIPWRVAFALQAEGWYLRQDIIWSKPNPMPESVRDRCTKAHEYLFLLSKRDRYYFDQDAIREPFSYSGDVRVNTRYAEETGEKPTREYRAPPDTDGRNKRSVWEVTPQPFSEAHFATFPPALIEPCILAGCPKGGTVLDCFAGAGTTGLVADRLQRNAILIELNPAYADMAERRITGDAPLFAEVIADYDAQKDTEGAFSEAYAAIRARVADGGPGWEPK